jgi:membrane protease YdiL (CAAX protease family)
VLYGVGWLSARPLAVLFPQWRPDQVNLAGVVVALLLLLFTLPWRLRRTWGVEHPWQQLGIVVPAAAGLRAFFRGLLKAAALLFGVVAVLLLSGLSQWQGQVTAGQLLNAIALLLGAGFAEELLFRGWLWGELELLGGRQRAIGLQATIFALVHPWYQLPAIEAVGLLVGLALLGLALALQRRADQGVLWGIGWTPRRTRRGLVCPASRTHQRASDRPRLAFGSRREQSQPDRRAAGLGLAGGINPDTSTLVALS